MAGSRVDVHVVETYTGAAHNLEVLAALDQARVDAGRRTHNERIVWSDGFQKLLGGQALANIDVHVLAQTFQARHRERLGYEDSHRRHATFLGLADLTASFSAFGLLDDGDRPRDAEAAAGYSGGMQRPELRPLSAPQAVGLALKIYRQHAAQLLLICGAVAIPLSALSTAIVAALFPDNVVESANLAPWGYAPVPYLDGSLQQVVLASVTLGLLSMIGFSIALGACTYLGIEAFRGAEPGVGQAVRSAAARLFPLVWLGFLIGLLVGIGFLALVAPGIWALVAWSVAIPVLIVEDRRGSRSLIRSHQLVKGRWWPTFGALLLTIGITALIQYVIGALSAGALGSDNESFGFATAVSAIFTWPLQALVPAVLYLDLRLRKESWDRPPEAEEVPGRPDLPSAPKE